jgi:hypothetical protein
MRVHTHAHCICTLWCSVDLSPSVKSKKLDPASVHVVYIHVYVRTRRQHAFAWCSTPAWTTALHTTRLEHSLKEGRVHNCKHAQQLMTMLQHGQGSRCLSLKTSWCCCSDLTWQYIYCNAAITHARTHGRFVYVVRASAPASKLSV